MTEVLVVDRPDYKLYLSIKPKVTSTLNEVTFIRSYHNDGISSNTSTFVLYLDQDEISKIINALQATKYPSWSLANDDHR